MTFFREKGHVTPKKAFIQLRKQLVVINALSVSRADSVSLWLGHTLVLTTHRVVVHYARAASLPKGRALVGLFSHTKEVSCFARSLLFFYLPVSS